MNKEFNNNLFANSSSCSDVRGHLSGQQLPTWVQGILLYNGPSGDLYSNNAQDSFVSSSKKHWMDGLSMMSSFKIQENGKFITFTKKNLRSDEYMREHEHGSSAPHASMKIENQPHIFNKSNDYQVSVYHSQSPLRRTTRRGERASSTSMRSFHRSTSMNDFMMDQEPTDNCNSSFYQFGDLILATNETSFERIVDPDSLATGDLIDMSHLFKMKSVRPLKDHNGDFYNLAASIVTGNKYHFIKFTRPLPEINYNGDNFPTETKFVSTIPSRFPHHIGYFHSFGMTDNYLIFCEQPMAYDVNKLKHNKNQRSSSRDCLEWMAGERNHFYIVDKKTGRNIEINYVTDRSYFFFNFVNCYESRGHIVVDMLTYDGPEIMDSMWVEKLKSCPDFYANNSNSRLMRFVLPLHYMEQGIDLNFGQWNEATAIRNNNIINIRPKIITCETGMENPKINPFFNFRKYNFTYVVGWMHGLNPRNNFANSITKIDMETGMTTVWKTGDKFEHPSEIVFLPNPSGSSEDDGVIISCVSNSGDRQGSYLVFLNARNMREIARANFDEPIPFGSHTHFVQRYY
ncbi:beta,beta-carotene 15,15'-dioxygenase [Lepeophtheirus salmonis]|nr:beta,beta-carotene 15,15'-dioxygenase-like [Lepeophtheirus salmonis]